MLAQLRALAKSPIIAGLLAILAASFVLWGVRDVFRYVGPGATDAVVQAGSRTVSPQRFQQIFQQQLKAIAQQSGQTVSPQDAIRAGYDRQLADQVATDEASAEWLRRMGLRVSDKLVVDELRKAPIFFNSVTGQFDRNAYEQLVHQQFGMTDAQFEGLIRDDIAQNQFVLGVAAPLRAPRVYGALVAAAEGEGRTFSYFVLPLSAVPAPAQPTDAQLNGFIKDNADRLKRKEMRVLNLLQFSSSAITASQPVSPADVQKRFNFEKDSLSTPEKRTVVQIPVRDAAQATRAAQALKSGATPEAAAQAVGAQPLIYTDQPKTAIADRKLADAAFAMAPGQVSGPVQGDLGMAVLKVVSATPGHAETLQEAQPKIEAEIRKSEAEAKVDQQVKKYEDARSGGANLLQAAQAAGVQPTTIGPVTAQGTTAQGQPAPVPPKLLQTAFGLPAGGDSDIVDMGGGDYAAVQVAKILPPAVPSLDEIRPLLTRFWMMRDLETRLQAKAAALADQIRKGQSLSAVAASVGAQVGNGVDIQRSNAGQTFSQQLLGELFLAKPGAVVVGPDVKQGPVVVARLQAVVPAAGPTAAQAAANARPVMTRGLLQDVGQTIRAAVRDQIKPRVDYARARAAVGGGADTPQ